MPAQRPRHAALASLLASLLLVIGLLVASPAEAGTAADEQLFVQLINQTRAGAGLPPLQVHGELTAQARSWAGSMATTDQLAHAPDISQGISAPWTVLGENVGVHSVQDVQQLHAAFVASPGHYANIVDPRYGYVGVGVVVTEAGKMWTTHRFMATEEAPTTTAPPTTSPPTTAPPDPSTTSTEPSTPAPDQPTTSTEPPTAPTTEASSADPAAETDDGQGPTDAETGRPLSEASDTPDASTATTAGPGRPDLDAVEQMLIDLVEAGI